MCLLLLIHCQQVAEQGLRPNIVLRVCNNSQITGPVLSHEITRLVAARAKAVAANILQKRNADATGLLVTLSTGKKEGWGSKQKRCAVSHNVTMNKISPISNEAHEASGQ